VEFGPLSRLVVISNRVSAPKARAGEATQGGLAMALSAALKQSGGIWFGWSGNTTDQFTGQISVQRGGGVTTATIDLEEQDVDEYYNGYANRTLWPLFHYRIDLAEFDRHFGEGYERVNDRFAGTLGALIEPDDLVWVHDYHLIPLGQRLRRMGIRNRLGFFLHIPWPPHRLMTSLPFHRRLVESILDYDVIGFQTKEWLDSFRDYVEAELGGKFAEDGTLPWGDRRITVRAFPIGVDVGDIQSMAETPNAIEAYETLTRVKRDRKVLIGVDRLDYSKGLAERFAGYQLFLEQNADWVRKTILMQIAPLTREDVETYSQIRNELDALSGHINGALAHVDWVPIRYVNQSYPRDGLAGFYRASEVALVTPLRDGMNLVAKEYVASQDPRNPGVLILSRFAGAAEQMGDALLVNPYSREDLARAIKRALGMALDERRRRWENLMAGIRSQDIHWWLQEFVEALRGKKPETLPNDRPALTIVS
jgi:trehalose 6-phosphate synthase